MLKPHQKVALYMEGYIHSDYGKMGLGVVRYLQNPIVGIIDSQHAGATSTKNTPLTETSPFLKN